MSEQQMMPQGQAGESLWESAPGWRRLTIAASLLTLAAVATPLLLPQPETAPSHPRAAAPVHVRTPQAPAPLSLPPVQHATLPPAAPVHVSRAAASRPAQTAAQAPACSLQMAATAPRQVGMGVITGFEDPRLSLARVEQTEAQNGGLIDPAYKFLPRVVVHRNNGFDQVFIVPAGMTAHVGDRVTLENGYRNMALPCNYVPITLGADLGPAPAAENPQAAATADAPGAIQN